MGPAGVVEDLGEHPDHVVVVVEDLVVVAPGARMPFGENRVRSVDHDLPDVRVVEERLERAVAGEVPQGPLDRGVRVGDVQGSQPPAVVPLPLGHLLIE